MDDLPTNAAGRPEALSYESRERESARGRNWLGIIAFMLSLIFNPGWLLVAYMAPFETGQPLHWIRKIVLMTPVPVPLLPLPGIILGIAALWVAFEFNQRRGFARAAVIIGIGGYLFLGAFFVFLMLTWNIG